MDDKRKINLQIADMNFRMNITSEREEELFRKAAKQINDKLNKYRAHFREESKNKILAMVAFELSTKALSLEEKNDTMPFKAKLTELTNELESFFSNNQ